MVDLVDLVDLVDFVDLVGFVDLVDLTDLTDLIGSFDFVNFAVTNLLDNQQRLQTNRIMEAVQEERIARSRANQPFETLDILDVIERVFRENMGVIARSGGGSGGGYYKHFTRKNRSNRRK